MRKYTYSRTIGIHTFTANEFDSFDEAVTAVEKGIYRFQLVHETYPVPIEEKIASDSNSTSNFASGNNSTSKPVLNNNEPESSPEA